MQLLCQMYLKKQGLVECRVDSTRAKVYLNCSPVKDGYFSLKNAEKINTGC